MTLYTVLAPPARGGEAATDPMDYVFVKEGIAWPALFFAVLWLIYRRMWLVLIAYVAVGLAAGVIDRWVGGDLAGVAFLLAHLLFALEGNELRRWTLRRRGYRLAGVVEGRNIEEAEIRYFAGSEETGASPPAPSRPPAPATPPPLGPVPPSAEAGDVVGLFPARGGAS